MLFHKKPNEQCIKKQISKCIIRLLCIFAKGVSQQKPNFPQPLHLKYSNDIFRGIYFSLVSFFEKKVECPGVRDFHFL